MKLKKATEYFLSLLLEKEGTFRFSTQSPHTTLLASDFAVMALFLTNSVDSLHKEKVIKALLEHKTAQNGFCDLMFDTGIERFHKPDYTINQFAFFTLTALDHLDIHFQKLDFFDEYLDVRKLAEWFDTIEWGRFWYESNKIMFWLYFYAYIIKYGNATDKARAKGCIEFSFNLLNSKQDKNTGYWGTDLNNNNIVDGCFGAAHIYLFYDYFGREINYKEKIIDNTLTLHTKNGLILTSEGGACEDYDAVEIYLRLMKQTVYRKQDIIKQLVKMKKTINRNQEPYGGFPYRISQKKYGLFKQRKEDVYRYSSWELMESRLYYSDSWGTFFRLLTLAVIDKLLQPENRWYKSYALPGWGYID